MQLALLIGRLCIGGAELAAIDLAHGLSQRGHSVTLYSLFDSDEAAALLPADARFSYLPLNGLKSGAVPIVAWQLLCACWRLRTQLAEHSTELLYSALNIANLIAWIASIAAPVRLVWSFHAADSEHSWEDRLATRICVFASPRVDAAVAVSAPTREWFAAAGIRPPRFEIIANGTDTQRLQQDAQARARQRIAWDIAGDAILVGVVARLAEVKAPERLVAALRIACAQVPRLHAVWIGGGAADYVASVQAQIDAAGLHDRLRLLGPSRDLRAVYNAFDVFALLSHSEGFGKVVAEAMAVALPCIVDRRAGAETLGDTGCIVDAADADAVAAAILQLAGDQALRMRLGGAARARVERELSLDLVLQRLESLFVEVLAQKTAWTRS